MRHKSFFSFVVFQFKGANSRKERQCVICVIHNIHNMCIWMFLLDRKKINIIL